MQTKEKESKDKKKVSAHVVDIPKKIMGIIDVISVWIHKENQERKLRNGDRIY